MRGLRIGTTLCLTLGLGMLMGAFFLLASRPPQTAPQAERLRFAALMTGYAIVLLLVFLATIVMAYLLLRKQREAFQEERISNLKELVEGAMQDQVRGPQEPTDE